ncbi:MAG: alpha/beta fold hydrolase, partial [Deltaproteobacteria bacterium]|nr:alpha/beta fold hydrolase [Deltaproteobacteria bacterium]
MAIQSSEIELKTGLRLHYVSQGDSQGKVVIFLHGYLDSWKSFQLVLDRLGPQHQAYAIDQRGHGDSDKPEGRYAIKDFSGDVIAFMDALGIERASLVGHSMGSFIARQVALSAPDRVERLVLIGTAPTCAGNPVLVELEELIPTLTEPLDPQFVYDFQVDSFHGPANQEFMATVVAETLKAPLRVWRDALAGLMACD